MVDARMTRYHVHFPRQRRPDPLSAWICTVCETWGKTSVLSHQSMKLCGDWREKTSSQAVWKFITLLYNGHRSPGTVLSLDIISKKSFLPSFQPHEDQPCRERILDSSSTLCKILRGNMDCLPPLALPPEPLDESPELPLVEPPCLPASTGSTLPWANSMEVFSMQLWCRISWNSRPVPTLLSGVPSSLRPPCSVGLYVSDIV